MADTLIIRPTSDVSKTYWTGTGDSSNLYANVDESSKNESDYNQIVTSTHPILYGFANHTTESGTINKITLKSYLKKSGDDNDLFKRCIKIGSTIYYSSQFYLTTSYVLHTWEMTVKPSNSEAWAWDDVDAFIGGSIISGQVGKYCNLLDCMTWAEVEYEEASGWSNIAKYNGVAVADIAKINGVAV